MQRGAHMLLQPFTGHVQAHAPRYPVKQLGAEFSVQEAVGLWVGSALGLQGGAGKAQCAPEKHNRRAFATPHGPPCRPNPKGRDDSPRHASLPARCVDSPHGLTDAWPVAATRPGADPTQSPTASRIWRFTALDAANRLGAALRMEPLRATSRKYFRTTACMNKNSQPSP